MKLMSIASTNWIDLKFKNRLLLFFLWSCWEDVVYKVNLYVKLHDSSPFNLVHVDTIDLSSTAYVVCCTTGLCNQYMLINIVSTSQGCRELALVIFSGVYCKEFNGIWVSGLETSIRLYIKNVALHQVDHLLWYVWFIVQLLCCSKLNFFSGIKWNNLE
jgi:hypothetical protein